MNKHTPGPWSTAPIADDYVVFRDENVIASIARETKNAVANTRIIAAAPELLEALEAYLRFSENILSRESFSEQDFQDMKTAIKFALPQTRAAIQKATE